MHPNVDPLYLRQRKGTEEDPFIKLQDTVNVFNGSVVLREIPSFADDLEVIDSEGTVFTKAPSINEIGLSEFIVDFVDGLVYFHPNNEGKQFTVEYWGTGMLSLPSTRIFVPNNSGDPIESLQNILDNVEEGTSIIEAVRNIEFRDEYDPTVQYQQWNFVTFANKTFVATNTIQGLSPVESSDWKLVSSGVGFVGVFNPTKTYNIGDMVSDENSKNIYFSKIMENSYPLTDEGSWELMVTLEDLLEKFEVAKIELQDFQNILEDSDQDREQNEQERQTRFDAMLDEYDSYHMLIQADEEARNANEEARLSSEIERNQLEEIRQTNEIERMSNEDARIIAEEAREQTLAALLLNIEENTNTSIDGINTLMNELEDLKGEVAGLIAEANQQTEQLDAKALELAGFAPIGEFEIETPYTKFNIVSHEGSSYMAKEDTQGNDIEDEQVWLQLSARGLDNMSITIDGIAPNENGEIFVDNLGVVRNEDFETFQNDVTSQIGDPSALTTANSENIVEAINELKRRLDNIVGIMS